MLRREGDGIAWWHARRRLLGHATDIPRVLKVHVVAEGEPAEIAEWTRRILERVHAGVRDVDPAARVDAPSTGFAEAFERLPVGPESEREALARIADGRTGNMHLFWHLPSFHRGGEEPCEEIAPIVEVGVRRFLRGSIWQLEVRTVPADVPEEARDACDDLWDELLDVAGRSPSTVWGAVSHDVPLNYETAYEHFHGITLGAGQARTHPRGYLPRNFLTATHLAALGGAAQVAARCAELGLRYEPVPRGDLPPGAVVGGEEPTLHTSDAALAAVRDLLDPILIHQPYTWYAGPPMRVLKEPGTAFRPVPPDIITPWFDDDPPLGPDSGYARRLVPDA